MRYFLALILLVVSVAAAADIYKWRDARGVVHFGDEAPAGAEKLELPPPTVYSAPPVARALPAPTSAAAVPAYNAAAIANPGPEETVRNATGEVAVSVALDPPLRPGHRIRLFLDGVAVGEPVANTRFTLRNVYRGAHTVHAEVLGGDGQALAKAGPQTFFLHRPTVLR